jgi:hypothetical protein
MRLIPPEHVAALTDPANWDDNPFAARDAARDARRLHPFLSIAWTLATLQIDMAMPGRFELRYVGRDGELHQPSMLHRAVLGSLERFIGVYLEHTAGDFPLWLAPVQALVLPIAERHTGYARKVEGALRAAGGGRVGAQREAELRIREAELPKIPIMLVVGTRGDERNGHPRRRRARDGAGDAVDVQASVTEEIRSGVPSRSEGGMPSLAREDSKRGRTRGRTPRGSTRASVSAIRLIGAEGDSSG